MLQRVVSSLETFKKDLETTEAMRASELVPEGLDKKEYEHYLRGMVLGEKLAISTLERLKRICEDSKEEYHMWLVKGQLETQEAREDTLTQELEALNKPDRTEDEECKMWGMVGKMFICKDLIERLKWVLQ
jgi:hypothetical protein